MKENLLLGNDAVLLGILFLIIFSVQYLNKFGNRHVKFIFQFAPPLLWCYILPSFLSQPLGWVNPSESKLYFVTTRFLLPAALIMLSIGVNFSALFKLSKKAVLIFFGGSLGVIIGGPIALKIAIMFFPNLIPSNLEELWKGLSTIAGSWIGGNANQAAMKETFNVNPDLFANLLIVDTIGANLMMALLLWGVPRQDVINKFLKADNSSLEKFIDTSVKYSPEKSSKIEQFSILSLFTIAFVGVSISHILADFLSNFFMIHQSILSEYKLESFSSSFFWVIIFSTTIGLLLSLNPKIRNLENIGASNYGTIIIYLMIATIGLSINVSEIFKYPGLLLIGLIWLLIHIITIFGFARIFKIPFFLVAIGSQANIGGTASTPIIAAAFNSGLIPLGIMLAILGNIVGTYLAVLTAFLMSFVVA